LQITFSILIVLQTFFSPFQGFLVDKFGPRQLLSLGAVLTGLSWILASQANSITLLYWRCGYSSPCAATAKFLLTLTHEL
jgi:MFS family permease